MEQLNIKLGDLNLINFTPNLISQGVVIGSGGFSKVISAYYKNLPMVVKKLKFLDEIEFLKEILNLKSFKHNNVPSLYGIFLDKDKLQVGLVTEIINGYTFDNLFLKNEPKESFQIIQILIHMIDLANVLNYFHQCNFIHRDLKPNNIIIDRKTLDLKLLDFGISKMSDRSRTTTILKGTVLYMAPENFRVPKDIDYDNLDATDFNKSIPITNKVDVWAFGCILSEIFSGKKPWQEICNNDNEIVSNLFLETKFPIPEIINSLSKPLHEIISMCMDNEPIVRPNMNFIKFYLNKLLYEYIVEGDILQNIKNTDLDIKLKHALFNRLNKVMKEYKFYLINKNEECVNANSYYDKLINSTIKIFKEQVPIENIEKTKNKIRIREQDNYQLSITERLEEKLDNFNNKKINKSEIINNKKSSVTNSITYKFDSSNLENKYISEKYKKSKLKKDTVRVEERKLRTSKIGDNYNNAAMYLSK